MRDNQKTYLIQNYKRQDLALPKVGLLVIRRGKNRYLDGLSGIAVNTLGHNHKRLVKQYQLRLEIYYTSQIFINSTARATCREISELTGLDKSFYCNSGLEANEAALKVARKFGIKKGIKKPKIIVFENAFHGRSFATMSASSGKQGKSMFGDTISGFVRAQLMT